MENKKLLIETQKALTLSDKANNDVQYALNQASSETEKAKKAQEQARQYSNERYKAEELVRQIERTTKRSKSTYKSFFIGNSIFTLVLAFEVRSLSSLPK